MEKPNHTTVFMKTKMIVSTRRFIVASSAVFLLAVMPPAWAATLTWTGAGANAAWTSANWAGGSFAAGADLVFNGSTKPLSYIVNNSTINSIIFSNGTTAAFTIRLEPSGVAARVLTFQSGNSGITIQAGDTFAHTIGQTLGSITLAGNLAVTHNGTQNFSIVRPIDGAFSLIKNGPGPLILSGSNTYSGGLTLNAGTLNINSTNALGSGIFTIAGGTINNTSAGAIINANNNSQAWNADFSFNGSADLDLGTGAVTPNADRNITVSGGNLTIGGAIGGAFGLTKSGAGTLTLSGASAYSGITIISNGTLLVNGSIAGSVALNTSTAKLGGSGVIGGSVTNVSGSQILPGANGAKGTLTINGDIILNGGSLEYQIDDNASTDKIAVNGNLLTNGITTFNIAQPISYLTNGDYTLMEVTGNLNGDASTFNFALTPAAPPSKVCTLVFDTASSPKKIMLHVELNTSSTALNWVGGLGGNVWDTTTANWTNVVTGGPVLACSNNIAVTFDSIGSANSSVDISGSVLPASVVVNSASDYTFTGIGGIGGTNLLSKSGVGTLAIATANSFTGAVSINEGTLVAANSSALGAAGSGVSVAMDASTNATLGLQGAITITGKPLTLRGDGVSTGVGALRNISGTNTWAGNIAMKTAIQTRIVSDAGKLVISGNLTNDGPSSGNVLIGGNGAGEISGNISGIGGLFKSSSGTNTWTLSGANTYAGTTTVANGTLAVTGSLTNGGGAVVVDNGTFASSGTINIGPASLLAGNTSSSKGIANIGAGTIMLANLEAGLVAGASGALNVTGGSVNTTAADGDANFRIGKAGYGAFHLSGGTVTTSRFQSQGGTGATGISLIEGGILNVTGGMYIGRNGAAGGQGVLTVSGGTVNHAGASGALNVGNAAGVRGELNLIGGSINNSGQSVSFGAGSGSGMTGIVNLNAGTLTANGFINVAGGTLNLNGAILQSSTNNIAFLPASLPVYVNGAFGSFTGGAVIDTAGVDDTLAASLLAPSGNGVSNIQVATEGSGYIGAPYVSISGDGSGATAVADMVDDSTGNGTLKISAIRITNPGINFSTSPTVTLSGGGATTAATIGTVTIAANTSGGLVKKGAGGLTLSGANTYTNLTTVSNGTLRVSGSLASGVNVKNGATLTGNGIISCAVTLNSGAALLADTNAISTLTINNTLTLAAGSSTSVKIDATSGTKDLVTGLATVNFGGTLTVENLSGVFTSGQTFQLFSAANYAGNFSATNLPSLAGSLKWAWTPTNGTLSVVSGTATTATNIVCSASSTNLALTWPGSHQGWYAQSNAVNLANAGDWHDILGSELVTNLDIHINPAFTNVFYRLRSPAP